MSAEADDSDPGLARKLYRTVTPPFVGRPDREMDAIGWGLFLGLIVVLIPLLPFLIVIEIVTRVVDRIAPTEGK